MRRIKAKIKEHDYFGQDIVLNFNKEGNNHKTVAGGFVSIILKLLMCVYFFMIFKKWLFKENNTEFSEIGLNDLEEADELNFHRDTTNMTLFFTLRKQSSGPLMLDDE